jgi:hypothetical protein
MIWAVSSWKRWGGREGDERGGGREGGRKGRKEGGKERGEEEGRKRRREGGKERGEEGGREGGGGGEDGPDWLTLRSINHGGNGVLQIAVIVRGSSQSSVVDKVFKHSLKEFHTFLISTYSLSLQVILA